MNDYYRTDITLSPFSEDAADLLAAFLADIGYESFETDSSGLHAYIKDSNYDENLLNESVKEFPFDTDLTFYTEFIEGKDWNEEWEKNYFTPISIGDKCVIHSSFHKDYPEAELDIVIDPKMAFGTGHHATTSMMATYLLEEDLSGKDVIDMGSGTGILAIIAKMRGASSVSAIEIDPGACINAKENFDLNEVNINIIEGDASSLTDVGDADYFLANINRNIILADLSIYIKHLKKTGFLIISGFYTSDIPLIEKAASIYNLQIKDKKETDNWVALKLSY